MFTTALALSFLVKMMNAVLKFDTLAADKLNTYGSGIVTMKQGHNLRMGI